WRAGRIRCLRTGCGAEDGWHSSAPTTDSAAASWMPAARAQSRPLAVLRHYPLLGYSVRGEENFPPRESQLPSPGITSFWFYSDVRSPGWDGWPSTPRARFCSRDPGSHAAFWSLSTRLWLRRLQD